MVGKAPNHVHFLVFFLHGEPRSSTSRGDWQHFSYAWSTVPGATPMIGHE